MIGDLFVQLLSDVLFLFPHLLLLAFEFGRGEHVRLRLFECVLLLQLRQFGLQRVNARAAAVAVGGSFVNRQPDSRIAVEWRGLHLAWGRGERGSQAASGAEVSGASDFARLWSVVLRGVPENEWCDVLPRREIERT